MPTTTGYIFIYIYIYTWGHYSIITHLDTWICICCGATAVTINLTCVNKQTSQENQRMDMCVLTSPNSQPTGQHNYSPQCKNCFHPTLHLIDSSWATGTLLFWKTKAPWKQISDILHLTFAYTHTAMCYSAMFFLLTFSNATPPPLSSYSFQTLYTC